MHDYFQGWTVDVDWPNAQSEVIPAWFHICPESCIDVSFKILLDSAAVPVHHPDLVITTMSQYIGGASDPMWAVD
ncbi:unnamed protein product [Protopolystoma xenopodis]|uniref:Uncharacterized protein n=1 Tax=Protopolystoma xenopodis TaxID=117903 RepID=A0A448XDZ1_9PLAT|nr:unnamed protein product [Protopolystoma xenopodis]